MCTNHLSLIAKGTIEEKINEIKRQKKELIERLIKPGGESIATLSAQELREILL